MQPAYLQHEMNSAFRRFFDRNALTLWSAGMVTLSAAIVAVGLV